MSREPRSPERCAEELAQALQKAQRGGSSTIRRYVKTFVHESGWQKRSKQNVAKIAAALHHAEVYADVDITDMDLPLNTWVHLAAEPFQVRKVGAIFGSEAAFNRYLRRHYEDAFDGTGLDGVDLVGWEQRVQHGRQQLKIDLVYTGPDGTAVVVELKRGDPTVDVAVKLRQYLTAYGKKHEPVRGVLITGVPRSAQLEKDILRELEELRDDYHVTWYQYRLRVDLEPVG